MCVDVGVGVGVDVGVGDKIGNRSDLKCLLEQLIFYFLFTIEGGTEKVLEFAEANLIKNVCFDEKDCIF